MTGWHVAMLQEGLDEGAVRCRVCPRLCRVAPGRSGVCRARVNRDGVLYAITYGRVCSVAGPRPRRGTLTMRSKARSSAGCATTRR